MENQEILEIEKIKEIEEAIQLATGSNYVVRKGYGKFMLETKGNVISNVAINWFLEAGFKIYCVTNWNKKVQVQFIY